MGRIALLSTFFTLTPLVLLFSLLFLSFVSYNDISSSLLFGQRPQSVAFAALPTNENLFTDVLEPQDARVEMLRQFFAKYKSPLEPHAEHVVKAAETYEIDFRLIPAIAMQESNLCKKVPKDSNNCWGFGIYGGKVTKFDNYEQAITTISKTLGHDYKEKRGLESPVEIMSRYTPSSNGSWAKGVTHFMEQLQ